MQIELKTTPAPHYLLEITDPFLTLPLIEEMKDCISSIMKPYPLVISFVNGQKGVDVHCFSSINRHDAFNLSAKGIALVKSILKQPRLVIAVANKYLIGGSLELALAADVRIADTSCIWGLPEVKLGLLPGFGGIPLINSKLGSRASEIYLFGDLFRAADDKYGVFNYVEDFDHLGSKTLFELIKKSFGISLNSIRRMKGLPNAIMPLFDSIPGFFADCCVDEDKKRGLSAFLNKEQPYFTYVD